MTQLLTIAGGVMSVYILLALITSHVCEWISAFTNQRGHLLERAIVVLLGGVQRDPTRGDATKELVDHLYDHPLMGNLGATKTRLPSYIPARTFSISLISSLRTYTAALDARQGAAKTAAPMPEPFTAPDVLLADLKGQIEGLPDGRLKSTLVTVLQSTRSDYDAALKAIDNWFDAQMDRVGGSYKRWAGIVQAIIALILVAALNSDTLSLIAQLHGTANPNVLMEATKSANGQSTGQLVNALSGAGVSIGWGTVPQGGEWVMKIAGLALTWFAVLMGAPFWFDVLKQIVPVRMAGAKPVASADEASDDKQAKHVAPTTSGP
jgi:hypothetical protein